MSILLQDIRASYDSHHFGASLKERSITIWRSGLPSPITTVRPGFSGGQNRHFIDPVNRLIYAGTWEDGLTCFDYADNRTVWHRSDLLGIQSVDLSVGFPNSLFVTLEAPDYRLDEPGVVSGIFELAAEDGRTKWATEDGDWMYADPKRPILVLQDRCDETVRILDGARNEIGSTPMVHFAIIDVGFSDHRIALAEGEKGVRIINHGGEVISRYAPYGRRPNCIRVAFSGDLVTVFDSWDGSFVTTIDPTTGEVVSEYRCESHGTICFIDGGFRFVDPSGRVCRSIDGRIETTLKAEHDDGGEPENRLPDTTGSHSC